jgi:hypothetical protein
MAIPAIAILPVPDEMSPSYESNSEVSVEMLERNSEVILLIYLWVLYHFIYKI